MNRLRSFLHQLAASTLRRRAARLQIALDEYSAMEQTRLSLMANRIEWHEKQAAVGRPKERMIP